MTCDDTRDQFSALVDDALSPEERRGLDAHLAGCGECRRELEAFRRTVALVRSAPAVRAPVGFVDRVLAAARPVPWYRRLARRLFVPLPVKLPIEAAAVVVVAIVAVSLYRQTPELERAARLEAPPPAVSQAPRPTGPPATPQTTPQATPPAKPSVTTSATPPATPPMSPPPATTGRTTVEKSPEPPAKSPAESAEGALRKESATDFRSTERDVQSSQEGNRLTPPESKSLPKDEGRAARERAPAAEPPPPARRLELPRALEPRADQATRQKSAAAQAPISAPAPLSAALAAVDVAGRLAVTDRAAAETALADLVARLGGAVLARRADADATIVDVRVPRAAYADLLRGLERIGRWTPEREAGELPEQVRVTLRLTP